MEIQSTKNTYVKELKKLHRKKGRQEQQRYLLEGFHLVEEAVNSQAEVVDILISPRGAKEWAAWIEEQALDVTYVSEEVMAAISEQPTPQGIMAVVALPRVKEMRVKGKWLLLDNVQDPGNVGTMIRTADAAGFTGVFLGEGTADIYNLKTLRSMQGSHFHIEIQNGTIQDICQVFKEAGIPVYGSELNEQAVAYDTVEKTDQVALIMGNEGQGVAKEILAQTDANLYIPIYGKAESLNVGIAAGILMYHFS